MAELSRGKLGWALIVGRGVLIALLLGIFGAAVATLTWDVVQRPRFYCTGAKPLEIQGKRTGFARCESGAYVRQEAVECPNSLPSPGHWISRYDEERIRNQRLVKNHPELAGSVDVVEKDACRSDADCTGMLYGSCRRSRPSGPNVCIPGCVKDSECAGDEICVCGEPVGECVKASCKTNADCPHSACAAHATDDACGLGGFSCLSDDDECDEDEDCGACACAYDEERKVRTCTCRACHS